MQQAAAVPSSALAQLGSSCVRGLNCWQSCRSFIQQLLHCATHFCGCRAAAADANDAAQFAELKTQGELTRRAWEKNVQVRPRRWPCSSSSVRHVCDVTVAQD
eukprot:GHRQ01034817.1.p2 GENE.GHRQ01034817.1~~GHRQ01034817.1.p2  ORF type:complete len:103 (+),score=36.27 GHRQ01034817.1:279-587(+)